MRVGIHGSQLSANGEPRLGSGFLPLGEKRVAHPYPSQAPHHDGREDSFLSISVCQGARLRVLSVSNDDLPSFERSPPLPYETPFSGYPAARSRVGRFRERPDLG